MQTCRHADMQTCRHADMQTCRHADMQTCRHADMQTRRHVDMQTCRHDKLVDILNLFQIRNSAHLLTHSLTRVKSRDASASKNLSQIDTDQQGSCKKCK